MEKTSPKKKLLAAVALLLAAALFLALFLVPRINEKRQVEEVHDTLALLFTDANSPVIFERRYSDQRLLLSYENSTILTAILANLPLTPCDYSDLTETNSDPVWLFRITYTNEAVTNLDTLVVDFYDAPYLSIDGAFYTTAPDPDAYAISIHSCLRYLYDDFLQTTPAEDILLREGEPD